MSRPFLTSALRLSSLAVALGLAGCQALPKPPDDGMLQREAMAGTEKPAPKPHPINTGQPPPPETVIPSQINAGTGTFIRPSALATPKPQAAGEGAVTFNFENQPVQAVVKAILGDLLKQNYVITPGVQGNISFSTSQPVDSTQALPILETLLSWTGNALVLRNGTYTVLPSKDAVSGGIVPSLGAMAPRAGLQARLFPLRFISANEMQKLVKPFARADSVLLVDPSRNLIVLSGTPQELENYQRTITTFDVDWLRGMSVGVFNLQHANVADLMPKLDGMFGAKGDTPLAGMFRFIPIERTNALVVITTQSDYLREIGGWITKIDNGGGNDPQLFVYDVRNIKASDLAQYLAQIYTNNAGNGGGGGAKVGPGLSSGTLGSADNAMGSASGMGSTAGSFGSNTNGGLVGTNGSMPGLNAGAGFGNNNSGFGSSGTSIGSPFGASPNNGGGQSGGQQYVSEDGSVRISSVDSNNQLLVRARPSQWEEIESAIRRLDNTPLQVQIETRILEVKLTGQFQFGVQWYLEGLIGGSPDGNGGYTPGQPGNQQQWAIGGGGATFRPGTDSFFYSFINKNLQVAVHAMETNGNTKTLSAPSLVVLNNQTAQIQVGDQVPINQTSVNPGVGTATYNQVNYLNTGVILSVQPRVNPGGLVYLNVQQQVSSPTTPAGATNPTISQRSMATQVAVQSGQTVLLGGLIQQNEDNTDTGVPGLNHVPIFGRLFGTTSRGKARTELIVLITPKVITNGEEAKQVTDEYQLKFESLAPLHAVPVGTTPAVTAPVTH
ncbi:MULTISPECIES: type II secretion system secretin GspD [Dyella]|uniref:Type II secretion system protein GspD n=2 Tax=Dyella TaxID=231454 RepID=A0A4R0YPH1_9GAMM|nr:MULTISPECIES: type II secretion system secretin GspD [Dyella]TBR36643.1 type II secretion system protein GspD [Dyella terrae]TCI08266.1 type II secretion system protein GspD [Dyella soli]